MKLEAGTPLFLVVALAIGAGGGYAMWDALDRGVLALRNASVVRAEAPIVFWAAWGGIGVASAFFLVAGMASLVRMLRRGRDGGGGR